MVNLENIIEILRTESDKARDETIGYHISDIDIAVNKKASEIYENIAYILEKAMSNDN